MKQISMTQAQLDSWTAQYTGDRTGIFYSGNKLNVPDDLYPAAAAINVSIAPSPIQRRAGPNFHDPAELSNSAHPSTLISEDFPC